MKTSPPPLSGTTRFIRGSSARRSSPWRMTPLNSTSLVGLEEMNTPHLATRQRTTSAAPPGTVEACCRDRPVDLVWVAAGGSACEVAGAGEAGSEDNAPHSAT